MNWLLAFAFGSRYNKKRKDLLIQILSVSVCNRPVFTAFWHSFKRMTGSYYFYVLFLKRRGEEP